MSNILFCTNCLLIIVCTIDNEFVDVHSSATIDLNVIQNSLILIFPLLAPLLRRNLTSATFKVVYRAWGPATNYIQPLRIEYSNLAQQVWLSVSD